MVRIESVQEPDDGRCRVCLILRFRQTWHLPLFGFCRNSSLITNHPVVSMGHATCLQAAVDFDAGHDALITQHIHKGLAIGAGLVQRLLKHDGSTDVLAQVWGSVQQLTPITSVGLCVVNPCTPYMRYSFVNRRTDKECEPY